MAGVKKNPMCIQTGTKALVFVIFFSVVNERRQKTDISHLSDLIITVSPSTRNLEGLSLDHGRQTGINPELLGSSEYSRTGSSNLIRAISFR